MSSSGKCRVVITLDVPDGADIESFISIALRSAAKKAYNQTLREPGCLCDAPEDDDVLRSIGGSICGSIEVGAVRDE